MITADEFKFELLNAYHDLGEALGAIAAEYGLSDQDYSPEEAIEVLLRGPDAARDIRDACSDFNEKVAALQRASFQVLRGGRQ